MRPADIAAGLFRIGENPNLPASAYDVLRAAISFLECHEMSEVKDSAADAHATALKIVHEEAGRTLSKGDFDLCMRIARAALLHSPTMAIPAGWTPVAEGLPVEPGWYLAMLAPDNDWGLMSDTPLQVEFDTYTNKPKAFTCVYDWRLDEDITDAVTHWMPMPAAPDAAPQPPAQADARHALTRGSADGQICPHCDCIRPLHDLDCPVAVEGMKRAPAMTDSRDCEKAVWGAKVDRSMGYNCPVCDICGVRKGAPCKAAGAASANETGAEGSAA